jgi:queuine tRNA-ribosyltransferase
MFKFDIIHKEENCKARLGVITTAHGKFSTPAFIPVATKATIKSLSAHQLSEIGFEACLSNTYHLYLQPGEEIVSKLGGLQKFMSWNKPMFTDSGGFQVYSLNKNLCKVYENHVEFRSCIDNSKHIFTPEKSMQIQHKLGADIIFNFDECIHFDVDKSRTRDAMDKTHRWAKRCLDELKRLGSEQALFGIVQGGQFLDLREESAKFIASLDFPGFGIGGIFGDPKKASQEIVAHTIGFLPYEKPKHMLGIGSVDDLFYYTQMGADTFDCVLATRLSRQGYAFINPKSGGCRDNKFRYRAIHSKFKADSGALDSSCLCFVCKNYTRGYIHHLYKANELLFYQLMTYHNLYFFCDLMKKIRLSIKEDRFLELREEWLGEK